MPIGPPLRTQRRGCALHELNTHRSVDDPCDRQRAVAAMRSPLDVALQLQCSAARWGSAAMTLTHPPVMQAILNQASRPASHSSGKQYSRQLPVTA